LHRQKFDSDCSRRHLVKHNNNTFDNPKPI